MQKIFFMFRPASALNKCKQHLLRNKILNCMGIGNTAITTIRKIFLVQRNFNKRLLSASELFAVKFDFVKSNHS